MNSLLTHRIKKLVAQTNCPACGADIESGGGGVAFAISRFVCGAELQTANDEIIASAPCPGSTIVAVMHLNKEAATEAAEAGAA